MNRNGYEPLPSGISDPKPPDSPSGVVSGGATIDVFAEWRKAQEKAERLESAASSFVDAQDAQLRPDGSVSCLRFVNVEALKVLMRALGHGPKLESAPIHPRFGRLIRHFFKCDPARTPEEERRISDRALDVMREGNEGTREFELALTTLVLRGENQELRDRIGELERHS